MFTIIKKHRKYIYYYNSKLADNIVREALRLCKKLGIETVDISKFTDQEVEEIYYSVVMPAMQFKNALFSKGCAEKPIDKFGIRTERKHIAFKCGVLILMENGRPLNIWKGEEALNFLKSLYKASACTQLQEE